MIHLWYHKPNSKNWRWFESNWHTRTQKNRKKKKTQKDAFSSFLFPKSWFCFPSSSISSSSFSLFFSLSLSSRFLLLFPSPYFSAWWFKSVFYVCFHPSFSNHKCLFLFSFMLSSRDSHFLFYFKFLFSFLFSSTLFLDCYIFFPFTCGKVMVKLK